MSSETEDGAGATARVVGIGVRPGGWPAMLAIARGLTGDGHAAYVVVHRQGDVADDHLVGELRGATGLAVEMVGDGDPVETGVIHLVPSGRDVELVDGALRTELAPPVNAPHPIDRFLRSLSDARGSDAVGVVVGTEGADGAMGLQRIKEVGGLTVAQQGAAGGLVDLVVPIEDIAPRLRALTAPTAPVVTENAGETLHEILTLVRVRSGHDFSGYKRATLLRRIERRMQVCETATITDYHRYLRDVPTEIELLRRDFLISVTNFFRDPAVFEALDTLVFPALFAGRYHTSQIRLWVPGCATGEEAYSLAILAAEHASRHEDQPQIQIFATDIDEQALVEARAGRYPVTVAADISAARIERFFTRDGSHLRVKKELREMVLFTPHNVLRDPPFSKLDLVSCRNLMIYLDREAQDRVLGIIHFGLRLDGYLVLGSSESAEGAARLFAPVSAKHRIYARRPASTTIPISTFLPSQWPASALPASPASGGERATSFGELHHKVVELYAPPSILVNEDLDIVHVSEHAGRYLTLTGGEPTRDLLRLVHAGLRLDLRATIYASRQHGRATASRPVPIELDGRHHVVVITARPLDRPQVARGMLLVTLEEQDGASAEPAQVDGEVEPIVHQLEGELVRTREQLRATVDQYETSVEELKASNEELQAINEELRSATEELETSKEELQSVNEELTTLNFELKEKVDEVSRANGDLQNLMTSTDIGVLFLDRDLDIQRYTPRALDLFNLIPSDIGRPLGHLTHRLEVDDLVATAANVLQTLEVVEQKVRGKDGRSYLLRVHPYRSMLDRIEGVVLTFLDISAVQAAEEALREREAMLRLAQHAAAAGSWELDVRTDRVRMSEEGCLLLGVDPEASLGLADWIDRVDPADRARVRAALRRAADHREDIDLEFQIDHPVNGARWLWTLGRHLDVGQRVAGLVVDTTARRRTEAELRASEERFRLALRSAPVAIFTQDRALRYDWGHLQGGSIEFVGKRDEDLFDAVEAARLTEIKQSVLDTGVARREEIALTLGGETTHYDYTVEPVRQDGAITGVRSAAVDVTASKRAELELREADRRKDEFLATLAHELRNPLTPIRAALDLQALAGDDLVRIKKSRDLMDRQLGQLVHIVDDLLEVSRISRGTIQLRRERVAISTVIDAAVEATSRQCADAGHTVVIDRPEEIVLSADPTRLTQVLTNLLSNAAKYTPRASTIRLSAARDGDWLEVRVQDQGIGMAPEELAHVFELFHRSAGPLDAGPSGLGIGLHLVRRMVELHGGTVVATSDGRDRGSLLTVRLPMGAPETSRVDEARPAPPRRHDVLVVDDNPDVAETVGELIEMLGHEVRIAGSGVEALRLIGERRPEIVFLDVGMPDLDGYEVARRIRALEGGGEIRLVALSGWGGAADVAKSRAAGIDSHLVKPANLTQLRAIVGDGR